MSLNCAGLYPKTVFLVLKVIFLNHFRGSGVFCFSKKTKTYLQQYANEHLVERFINADTTIFTVNAKTQIISAVCVIAPTNCCCSSLPKYRIRWRGHRPGLRLWPDSLDL